VRPDDKKRGLADVQFMGCRWRKPCIRILIVGPSRQHDGRFDDGRAVPRRFFRIDDRRRLDDDALFLSRTGRTQPFSIREFAEMYW